MKILKTFHVVFATVVLLFITFTSCNKKDSFIDTGVHTAKYDGSILDYLKEKRGQFDSIVKIIQIAGMENVFDNEEITFFAPADSSVNNSIEQLNMLLQIWGLKEVKRLEQIKPEVWAKFLSRYVFKGKKAMNDYPQIDIGNLSAFPGQVYTSYSGQIMNIGVVYDDAGTADGVQVKYAGYRHLLISYIPSISTPLDYRSWYSANVASVNIAPRNGYIHALRYSYHYFGFSPFDFFNEAMKAGID